MKSYLKGNHISLISFILNIATVGGGGGFPLSNNFYNENCCVQCSLVVFKIFLDRCLTKKKTFFFNKLMPLYLQVHIISTNQLAKGKCASSFVSVLFFSPFAICSFCLITFTLLSFPSCILPSSVLVWITVSGCYREKREVNSLSPRLINNMTQKLTEWVWMVAKKEGDTLTSTTTTASTATAVVAAAVPFSLQLDLCNLGNKILV